jgi:hypothetical protein
VGVRHANFCMGWLRRIFAEFVFSSLLLFNSRLFSNSATIEFFSVVLCSDSIASFVWLLFFVSAFPPVSFSSFIPFLARHQW